MSIDSSSKSRSSSTSRATPTSTPRARSDTVLSPPHNSALTISSVAGGQCARPLMSTRLWNFVSQIFALQHGCDWLAWLIFSTTNLLSEMDTPAMKALHEAYPSQLFAVLGVLLTWMVGEDLVRVLGQEAEIALSDMTFVESVSLMHVAGLLGEPELEAKMKERVQSALGPGGLVQSAAYAWLFREGRVTGQSMCLCLGARGNGSLKSHMVASLDAAMKQGRVEYGATDQTGSGEQRVRRPVGEAVGRREVDWYLDQAMSHLWLVVLAVS